jgi:hypothetical protein
MNMCSEVPIVIDPNPTKNKIIVYYKMPTVAEVGVSVVVVGLTRGFVSRNFVILELNSERTEFLLL